MAKKTIDSDIVVIGAGGTGMIAAVRAAELTGKKVVVIEKSGKIGGATVLAHGIQISDSTWQKEAGETWNEPRDETGVFFDWLVTWGGAEEYFKISDEKMQSMTSLIMYRRIEKYKDHPDSTIGPGWMGTYICDKMMECCNDMGVDVLTNTAAKTLLTDSSGKVNGVICDSPDGELQINFDACFISAGGFGANYNMCKELWPETFNDVPVMCLCPPSLTGDLIVAAEEVGAAIDMNPAGVSNSAPIHHPYSYGVLMLMQYQGLLRINLAGDLADEGDQTRYNEPLHNGNFCSFSICDADILELAGENAPNATREALDIPLAKRWREDVELEVSIDEKGGHGHHTKKADSLIELALKMDINPQTFIKTIETYNKKVKEQIAAGTAREGVLPIEKAPFYAFYAHRFTQCTHGGIVVNDDMAMLDAKGNIMPGMFAGGDCTTYYKDPSTAKAAVVVGGGGAPGGAPGGQEGGGTPGAIPDGGGQGGGEGAPPPMSGGPQRGVAGMFGDYLAEGGGGLPGIVKGKKAGESIAKYFGMA